MIPLSLFSLKSLPTRGPKRGKMRQQYVSRCSTVIVIASEAWECRGLLTDQSLSQHSHQTSTSFCLTAPPRPIHPSATDKSLTVTKDTYSSTSRVSFPSALEMDPSSLSSLKSLPARGPKREKCVSSATSDALQ